MRKETPISSPEDPAPGYGWKQGMPREICCDFPQNSLQSVPPLGRDAHLLGFLSKEQRCYFFSAFNSFFYPKDKLEKLGRIFSQEVCPAFSICIHTALTDTRFSQSLPGVNLERSYENWSSLFRGGQSETTEMFVFNILWEILRSWDSTKPDVALKSIHTITFSMKESGTAKLG